MIANMMVQVTVFHAKQKKGSKYFDFVISYDVAQHLSFDANKVVI